MNFMTRQRLWRRPRTQRLAFGTRAATVVVLHTLAGSALLGLMLTGCGSGNGTAPTAPLAQTIVQTPTQTPTPVPSPTASGTPALLNGLTPPYANKVAFFSSRGTDENDHLYVMNPDGSQVTPINPFNFPDYNDRYIGGIMSSDGSKFILTLDVPVTFDTKTYFVNADGTSLRDITSLLNGNSSNTDFSIPFASLNANGTRLVFTLNDSSGGTTSLFTMNADGSARTRLYTTSDLLYSPIFSPDGQTLYFIQAKSGNPPDLRITGSVYRLGPGSTPPALVAKTSIYAFDGSAKISISADGTKIVFNQYVEGGSDEIFIANTDGTSLKRLTTNANLDEEASFTADGSKIIFVSYRDGNAELYSMNPDGSAQTRLSYQVEPDVEPATRANAKASHKTHSGKANLL